MSHERSLEELARRRERARALGSPQRLAERRAAGMLDARQRIDALLDAGSFFEVGQLAVSERATARHRTPADGLVVGFGDVEGRKIAVVSYDFTTLGASTARVQIRKARYVKRIAKEEGLPLVILAEAGGARVPDFMGARGIGGMAGERRGYVPARRRESPWITAVLGRCFGSPTWDACRSDIVVMRRDAVLAVSSEQVTSVAISETPDAGRYGSAELHSEVTGVADLVVDDDHAAIAAVRRLLRYLPGSNAELPPTGPGPVVEPDVAALLNRLPAARQKVYDVRPVIECVVDRDSFLPLRERYGRAVVTGLARIDGRTVGIVASNPRSQAGALGPEACEKAAAFVVMCDSFNVPLVLMADTPGFFVGAASEARKLPLKVIAFADAVALCTVPVVALVLRKSFGQAYVNFGGDSGDMLAAWCMGEVSLMDPAVANSVRRKGSDAPAADDVDLDTSAFALAEAFIAQDVLDPRETRGFLRRAFEVLRRRRSGGIGQHLMQSWPARW